MRLWSFLVQTGYIVTPEAITAGTATVTLGSPSVVVDVPAAVALNAAVSANPPLFHATQIGIGRQFRLASQTSGTPGPFYNITGWNNSTRTLTLDRPYMEATGANQRFTVLKVYYQAPPADGTADPDFLRYLVLVNPASGYSIRGRRLYYTQSQLDGIDPQRGATGTAFIIASYLDDPASGNPVHEFYPIPVVNQAYTAIFQKRGMSLSDTADVPKTFPSDLLITRAYQLGCLWALRNIAIFPELGQSNWLAALAAHEKMYKERLIAAIRQDDEISPLVIQGQGGTYDLFVPGGQFLQSHDISRLIGGLGV